MTFLTRLFAPRPETTSGSAAAKEALAVSSDLIRQMQERSQSSDAVRALLADIWAQRHNVPYVTTVFEANREMKAATDNSDGNADNDRNKS